jgi:hypothetical protein
MFKHAFLAGLSLFALSTAHAEEAHVAPMTELAKTKIHAFVSDPVVIDAIKAQNAKTGGYSQADIDKADKEWRAETKAAAKPMIDEVIGNKLSAYLKKVQADGAGLYTEIFVMDAKGLNVGQSEVTSDYWQGDEAKFQKSFGVGPDAIFVDDVEKDESTQTLQSQVSMTINDPATKQPIGAVTVGVNVDALK